MEYRSASKDMRVSSWQYVVVVVVVVVVVCVCSTAMMMSGVVFITSSFLMPY